MTSLILSVAAASALPVSYAAGYSYALASGWPVPTADSRLAQIWSRPHRLLISLGRGTLSLSGARPRMLRYLGRKRLRSLGQREGGTCFLGDSDFATWSDMGHDLGETFDDPFNLGIWTATTSHLLLIADQVRLLKPKQVVVHAGRSDWDEGERSPAEVAARLASLRTALGPECKVTFLLSGKRPGYSDEKWDFIDAVWSKIAAEQDVLDLRGTDRSPGDYLFDGVHLSPTGRALVARAIGQLLPETAEADVDDDAERESTAETASSACVVS